MENTEKKPRKFLKTLGKIGEIFLQEILLKIGSNIIKRIGGKKTLPSILFLILSICVYGQYPATGNKQRLGYQTSGDGLVWRGRASDTVALKSSTINNSYVILDTINNVMLVYIKTKGGWKYNNADTIIVNNNTDTTSLSSRINLKVNISDTASMLLKYLRKADTSLLNLNTRFAAKLNLLDTASMLTNYLRSGIAASTYLPLTGGTLTGTIKRQDNNYNGSPNTFYFNLLNYFARKDNEINQGQTAQITFTDRPGTFNFPNAVRTSDIYLMTAHNWNGSAYGQYLDTTLSVVASQGGGSIGIGKLNPAYKLDVNGTLGVTGAATLSDLTGTGTRMVTASSIGLLSTQTIPTGTLVASDTVSLSNRIDGKVSLNGTETINGSKSFNNVLNVLNQMTISGSVEGLNKILGKNTDGNRVGDITVGTGLSLTSNTLNASVTDTTSLSNRINLKYNSSGGTISGAVTLSTTTATPTSLLGKDGSNVIGEVTTVAQTGLMTRGSTTATTGTPSAVFTITHGLGFNPTSVIVTGAGTIGAQKLIFEVYAKSSTTFSVQVWNYDGTEAASKSVTIYWLAIK